MKRFRSPREDRKIEITIELDVGDVEALVVLDAIHDGGNPAPPHVALRRVLHEMIARACDGLRRPGAWERDWLRRVFAGDFEARLEEDPAAPWRQRPRRVRP